MREPDSTRTTVLWAWDGRQDDLLRVLREEIAPRTVAGQGGHKLVVIEPEISKSNPLGRGYIGFVHDSPYSAG